MKIEKAEEITTAMYKLNSLKRGAKSATLMVNINGLLPSELIDKLRSNCDFIINQYFAAEIKKAEAKLNSL